MTIEKTNYSKEGNVVKYDAKIDKNIYKVRIFESNNSSKNIMQFLAKVQ